MKDEMQGTFPSGQSRKYVYHVAANINIVASFLYGLHMVCAAYDLLQRELR
jgi:hypothetical protein